MADTPKQARWEEDAEGNWLYLRVSDQAELHRIEKRIKEGEEKEFFTLLPGGDLRSSAPALLKQNVEEHFKREKGIEPVPAK